MDAENVGCIDSLYSSIIHFMSNTPEGFSAKALRFMHAKNVMVNRSAHEPKIKNHLAAHGISYKKICERTQGERHL